ncbi:hypothetical protein ACFY3G_02840 [Streptomyces phaeochromogenes]|uniref:hypothetical protein n=1 Tax=Streptomyces phaeochromogenes TaxID=1923 RepID=UPI0036CFAEE7
MITDRRYEYGATAGALTLATIAAACAHHRLWPHAAMFLLVTGILLEAAARERRNYRRRRAEAQRAERLGRPMHPVPPPLEPCCALYRDSVQVGVSPVHSLNCHRVQFEEAVAQLSDSEIDEITRDTA